VLALVWIYGVVDHGDRRERFGTALEDLVLPLMYLLLGAAIASWWALLLPFVTIVLALPAGRNYAIEGDLDWVAFDPVGVLPYALVGTAAGVWIGRRLASSRSRTRGAPRSGTS
jgi:uncharacterized membrane protein YfcA